MDLSPLIQEGTLTVFRNQKNEPSSLSLDSRKVEEDALFLAIPGQQKNGMAFIEEALRKGASIIVAPQEHISEVAERFQEAYPSVSFFGASEIRKAASRLAAAFYPLQPETIVAVTGTNGKTSVVSFIRQIWHHLEIPAASLGTLGLVVEGRPLPNPSGTGGLNTPDPIKLHEILQDLKKQNIDHLAFEASSHGFDQYRLDGVRLKAGVFTNLSQDHLDYHQTIENYFEAKARLFKEVLGKHSHAILNADIAEYERLSRICKNRGLSTLSFGKGGETVKLMSLSLHPHHQDLTVSVEGKIYHIPLPLVGGFQAYNVLAALTAVLACGGDRDKAIEACQNVKGVPGRLEQAASGIYVDYSHTPDGLSLALQTLRPHTKGKLWVVFGCGGERDASKRPIMGGIAEKLADKVIVTDDNPRHEDPALIRQEILANCPKAQEVPSRSEAIEEAIKMMGAGDLLLIAGKGHEQYQLVGDQVFPFNDVDEVKKWVKQ